MSEVIKTLVTQDALQTNGFTERNIGAIEIAIKEDPFASSLSLSYMPFSGAYWIRTRFVYGSLAILREACINEGVEPHRLLNYLGCVMTTGLTVASDAQKVPLEMTMPAFTYIDADAIATNVFGDQRSSAVQAFHVAHEYVDPYLLGSGILFIE